MGSIIGLQLIDQILHMKIDGRFRDAKDIRDLLVAVAIADEAKNVQLADQNQINSAYKHDKGSTLDPEHFPESVRTYADADFGPNLVDIAAKLERLPDIPVVRLAEGDIVRHPLVASMLTVL